MPQAITVIPGYASAAGWDAWVRNTGGRLRSSGAGCSTLDTAAQSCFHAGILRKAEVPGLTSCVGLTAVDDLGALDWACDDSGPAVVMYSTGFLGSRGLSDLVDAVALQWRPNALTVSGPTGVLARSTPATWWNNAIRALPSGETAVELTEPATVYVHAGGMTPVAGYNINADGISLVVMPGSGLVPLPGAPNNCTAAGEVGTTRRCLVGAAGQTRLWLEGLFDGGRWSAGGIDLLLMLNVRQTRLHRVMAVRSVAHAINLWDSSNIVVTQSWTAENGGAGALVNSSSALFDGFAGVSNVQAIQVTSGQVLVSGLLGADNSQSAINTDRMSNSVVVDALLVNNGNDGIHLAGGDNNTFVFNTWASNSNSGLEANSIGTGSWVHGALAVNNFRSGVYTDRVDGLTLSSARAVANRVAGFTTSEGFADFRGFSGVGTDGLGGAECRTLLLDGGVVTGLCSDGLRRGLVMDGTMVGPLFQDDTVNQQDVAGESVLPAGDVVDYFAFEQRYRAWGRNVLDYRSANSTGPCRFTPDAGSSCRIWDWRLRRSAEPEPAFFGNSGTGGAAEADLVAGQPCPPASTASMPGPGDGGAYLLSAVEVLFDFVGNDNGLCESGEACRYAPNHGAYQGEGAWVPCQFQNSGAVQDVSLQGRTMNGVP